MDTVLKYKIASICLLLSTSLIFGQDSLKEENIAFEKVRLEFLSNNHSAIKFLKKYLQCSSGENTNKVSLANTIKKASQLLEQKNNTDSFLVKQIDYYYTEISDRMDSLLEIAKYNSHCDLDNIKMLEELYMKSHFMLETRILQYDDICLSKKHNFLMIFTYSKRTPTVM